jgi:hypothetical protein
MSRVGFEPTIPVFERAEVLRALGGAAAVIGKAGPPGMKRKETAFTYKVYQFLMYRNMQLYVHEGAYVLPVSQIAGATVC